MLSWWKRFDTSETRSNVKELSFQCDNGEQHSEGTLCAYRLRRVMELLADIFVRACPRPLIRIFEVAPLRARGAILLQLTCITESAQEPETVHIRGVDSRIHHLEGAARDAEAPGDFPLGDTSIEARASLLVIDLTAHGTLRVGSI
jgi:hypothetical protein